MLSNCVNEKNVYTFVFIYFSKVVRAMKYTINTHYSIELSVHKQPSVFNTTYTIQSLVNCLNIM